MPKNPTFVLTQFSPAARYALSAASYLARRPETLCSAEDIAAGGGLPRSFLAKILKRLSRRGLVSSRRGPGGGHALARPADEITLAEIVAAVEKPAPGKHRCLLELRDCGNGEPCAIHDMMVRSERRFQKALSSVTLGRYAAPGKRP